MAENTYKLTVKGPEDKTHDFPIPIGVTTIGRQTGSDLALPHSQVSRSHARIEAISQECTITDLGSSNGTYVNGEKLAPNAPVTLKDGDTVKIGPFEMHFSQAEAAPEPRPSDDTLAGKAAEPDPSVVEEVEPPPPPKKKPAARKPRAKKPATAPKPAKEAPPDTAGEGPPPPPAPPVLDLLTAGNGHIPPGLDIRSRRLLPYLPGIFHTDFMARFLGIFEATLVPLEWTIDNFDLFLSPDTSPKGFLPWLAGWFGLTFDSTWSDEQRRTLLKEAHRIYARRGTRWAMARVLEIYTGEAPEIDDTGEKIEPFTFEVSMPQRKRDVDPDLIEALIDAHKPAHTSYTLKFRR